MADDPTAGMTDTARALYDRVIGDWSGRELRKVIASDPDASDADRQAVTAVLYTTINDQSAQM